MLNPKASIVTLTYFGAEKTIEGYNAMGGKSSIAK